MNLFVFRHAETERTKLNIPYGDEIETASILPEGIKPTKKIAQYLKAKVKDNFYSSPYSRCIQTSEIVKKIIKVDFLLDKRLSEYRDDLGETIKDLKNRTDDFLKEQAAKNTTITVCTHGGVIAAIKNLIVKNDFKPEDLHDFPNPGVLVEIKDKNISYKDFN